VFLSSELVKTLDGGQGDAVGVQGANVPVVRPEGEGGVRVLRGGADVAHRRVFNRVPWSGWTPVTNAPGFPAHPPGSNVSWRLGVDKRANLKGTGAGHPNSPDDY
jgi:hypothetical protein